MADFDPNILCLRPFLFLSPGDLFNRDGGRRQNGPNLLDQPAFQVGDLHHIGQIVGEAVQTLLKNFIPFFALDQFPLFSLPFRNILDNAVYTV